MYQRISDAALKVYINLANQEKTATPSRQRKLLLFSVLGVAFLGLPALAQQPSSATDNVIVKLAWHVTKLVFWGLGGLGLVWAVMLFGGRKIFNIQSNQSAVTPFVAGTALVLAPFIADFIISFLKNEGGGSFGLENMFNGFDETAPGGTTP